MSSQPSRPREKSKCHHERRNSPSVAACRPISSCLGLFCGSPRPRFQRSSPAEMACSAYLRARLLQRRGAQQAADHIGAERRFGSLHGALPIAAFRDQPNRNWTRWAGLKRCGQEPMARRHHPSRRARGCSSDGSSEAGPEPARPLHRFPPRPADGVSLDRAWDLSSAIGVQSSTGAMPVARSRTQRPAIRRSTLLGLRQVQRSIVAEVDQIVLEGAGDIVGSLRREEVEVVKTQASQDEVRCAPSDSAFLPLRKRPGSPPTRGSC